MQIGKIIAALSLLSIAANAANRVEHLVPPKLTSESIASKVPCVRPMREGTFNISSEEVRTKFVVHCYGHGGCGWTTFMGSVERAVGLLEKQFPDPKRTPPIRIIGSGCMGLCSAIELTKKGYDVAGITTKELYNIPSWNAAGYFAVVSVKTSPEEEAAVKQIGLSTFKSYQQVEKGEHPYLSAQAVRFLPVYSSEETHAGVEELEEQGLIPPREVVDVDFGNGVVHRNYNKFMTYFFDVTTLMQDLHKETARLGIPIDLKKIDQFDDVAEEIVFNCSGLGGGDLAHDFKMIPVRGHLAMLSEESGKDHMDYMIYSKVKQDGKEEYVYLFPRTLFISPENPTGTACAGVLGGTFIPNFDKLSKEELAELDDREMNRLLDRNSIFFHGTNFTK